MVKLKFLEDRYLNTAFENIFLNNPFVENVLESIIDFSSLFGEAFTTEQAKEALCRLETDGHVVLMTTETLAALERKLRNVHGPVNPPPEYPHFSVTAESGKAWLRWYAPKVWSRVMRVRVR